MLGLDFIERDLKINPFTIDRLYPGKEVPTFYKKRLAAATTHHFLIVGKDANKKIHQLKGKWIDMSKKTPDMSPEDIRKLVGTGLRGKYKQAAEEIEMNPKKWENFIHASDNEKEALLFLTHAFM